MYHWRVLLWGLLLCGAVLVLPGPVALAQEEQPVVRAVLFYSPTCPHCHYVMDEVLTPLQQQYGEQCDIMLVDVSHPDGQRVYQAAIQQFRIPDTRLGVPTMIVDETVLVGSQEIPMQFPGLLTSHLEAGGNDWPAIPGLPVEEEAPAAPADDSAAVEVPAAPADESAGESAAIAEESALAVEPQATDEASGVMATLARDPAGNALAVLLLVGMVGVVGYSVYTLRQSLQPAAEPQPAQGNGKSKGRAVASARGRGHAAHNGHTENPAAAKWRRWAIPALALLGLVVSGYLTYVETTAASAVCGPVGDCHAVQQSEYARLFGVPVGMLGIIGYIAILAVWAVGSFGAAPLSQRAWLALLVFAFGGTLFSIYLTFLEPFVIGASCLWCLTSAAVMGALLLLVLDPARQAWQGLQAAK